MGSASNTPSAWQDALSAEDLCACAVRFLDGELDSFPGWGAPDVDEETDPLLATLKRCCQGGFLTVASQPAGAQRPGADGRMERRRAFVTGFASPGAVERIRSCLPAGLHLFAHPSSLTDLDLGLVVGERGGDAFLLAGAAAGPLELAFFAEEASAQATKDLSHWQFTSLIEEAWNRDDRLWCFLDQALGS
ncbi:MAG: hypothetical protein OSB42_04565 [Planctomycetota bacterium]|nr:hypothetical protein [Planctomycetota bacterium]